MLRKGKRYVRFVLKDLSALDPLASLSGAWVNNAALPARLMKTARVSGVLRLIMSDRKLDLFLPVDNIAWISFAANGPEPETREEDD